MSNQLLPCPFCQNPAEEVSGCKGWFSCADEECPAWHIQAKADDWNRRATQPAAGEPVAINVNYADEVDLIRAVLEGYSPSIARADALCSVKLLKAYFAAPPAAAHGDEKS